ncbi:MAG: DUF3147 family protein [Sedimentisphaerales bacterium]|nr:DUF3147 family protein [Sedimentisphaerales bacterium]
MRFIIKLFISLFIITLCTSIGKKLPSLAGLISVMPLTGLIVLVWLYIDNPGNHELMARYTRGALFGILPTILFFLTCFICFQRRLSLTIALCAGFAVWIIAAFIHQWLLK